MVRLPARLTSKLAKARIAQVFNAAAPGPLLHCVNPAEVLHGGAAAPVSHEKMHALLQNPAPIIWIGGGEPLVHSGIGHFARAFSQSGHCVFLETNGTALRRRIHEFQPVRELFLTLCLDSVQVPESALTVEGLRAGHLSGFFTVIHSRVHEGSDPAHLRALRSFIAEKDVDGCLITAASPDEAAVRKAAEARGLIRSGFWRQFSEHVEEALLSQLPSRAVQAEIAQPFFRENLPTEASEEGVRMA